MDSEANGLKEFQVKGKSLYKRDGVLMQVAEPLVFIVVFFEELNQ
jgi:hypothetical protein